MRVLVVFCHPLRDSFCGALLDRAVAGLCAGGHELRVVDLYRTEAAHDDDLRWCEALALVYPTWWSGQPALLTQWLQELFTRTRSLRNVRRVIAVTSHGSPRLTNMAEGESGKRFLVRALRLRCAPTCRSRWVPLYGLDRADADERARMLAKVERRLTRAKL